MLIFVSQSNIIKLMYVEHNTKQGLDRKIHTLDEEYLALEKLLTHLFAIGEAVELKAHNRAKTFQSHI